MRTALRTCCLILLSALAPWHAGYADSAYAVERTAGLQQQLNEAYLRKGTTYRPRTEHFNEDGAPRYTNRLILESSPYLLQHAHNPVDWHPWSKEAFDRARRENKPVFLSIGYSTCHWCHVMERESFENTAIAQLLNEHFIAIKVDRETHPDVDATDMAAVRIIAGRGGWPSVGASDLWRHRTRQFRGTQHPAS